MPKFCLVCGIKLPLKDLLQSGKNSLKYTVKIRGLLSEAVGQSKKSFCDRNKLEQSLKKNSTHIAV